MIHGHRRSRTTVRPRRFANLGMRLPRIRYACHLEARNGAPSSRMVRQLVRSPWVVSSSRRRSSFRSSMIRREPRSPSSQPPRTLLGFRGASEQACEDYLFRTRYFRRLPGQETGLPAPGDPTGATQAPLRWQAAQTLRERSTLPVTSEHEPALAENADCTAGPRVLERQTGRVVARLVIRLRGPRALGLGTAAGPFPARLLAGHPLPRSSGRSRCLSAGLFQLTNIHPRDCSLLVLPTRGDDTNFAAGREDARCATPNALDTLDGSPAHEAWRQDAAPGPG